MLKTFRQILFWCHLACGVVAGVIILVMCVTGVVLTYQKELQWWADTRHYYAPPPPDGSRASVADLVSAMRAFDPPAEVTTIAWRREADAPAAVAAGGRTIYVNPYTAAVYGEGTGQGLRQFFTSVVSWHRYLALAGDARPTGKAITGAANLAFLFIVLSGMYLWWPRTLGWRQVRSVLWFRGGLRARARDFNWHNTIGFWSALPLAVVVYSATVISYPWSNDLVYRAWGEEPPARGAGRGGGGGRGAAPAAANGAAGADAWGVPGVPSTGDAARIDTLVDQAMARGDWFAITLRVPESAEAPAVFTIDGGDAGQPHLRGTLTIDPAGGAQWEDFGSQTAGRRTRSILRFAHTGEVLGIAGQTIAGLVSAGGAVLVYTGLRLACRRLFAFVRRSRVRAVSVEGESDAVVS